MKEWALKIVLVLVVFMAATYVGTPAKVLPMTTSDCDLGVGSCVQSYPGEPHILDLRLARTDGAALPLATEIPLAVSARVVGGNGHNPVVSFTGSDMGMKVTTVKLLPVGGGNFTATVTLPVCVADQMRWVASLDVDVDGDLHAARFGFVTKRSGLAGAAGIVGTSGTSGSGTSTVTPLPPTPVDFALHTKAGPLTLASQKGKVVVVTFGYTFCPDVCPTSLAATAAALKQLTAEERSGVVPVFVSVDPARDSLDHVADYVAFFDSAYVGASGSDVEVKAAADVFGVFYERHLEPGQDPSKALIDHTTRSYLVDKDGRLTAAVAHGAPAADVDAAIRTLLAGGSL